MVPELTIPVSLQASRFSIWQFSTQIVRLPAAFPPRHEHAPQVSHSISRVRVKLVIFMASAIPQEFGDPHLPQTLISRQLSTYAADEPQTLQESGEDDLCKLGDRRDNST
jgi:hypothetical protein